MIRIWLEIYIHFIFAYIATSKDVFVDTELTEETENSYPNLDKAILAVLGGDENYYTITLKPSCAGKIFQPTRPALTINGINASLTIIFEDAPQPNDVINCSQLPTLMLKNDSYLDLTNFQSLVFIGLNIQYIGSNLTNWISEIGALTFSNFCFNNSEPSKSLATDMPSHFEIVDVKTLSMRNGIYIYDAVKKVIIQHAREVILENITLIASTANIDNDNSAFQIIPPNNSIRTSLTMTHLKIICEPAILAMPSIIWTTGVDQVLISNVSISNCNFRNPAMKIQGMFLISGASILNVREVSLHNLTYGLNSQSVFAISSVLNSTLRDFSLLNLEFQGENAAQVVFFNDTSQQKYIGKNAITFEGWNLTNCNFTTSKMLIYGIFRDYSNLGGIILDNFTVINTILNRNCNLFNLQIPSPPSGTTYHRITHVVVRNIHVNNTIFLHSEMLTLKLRNTIFIAAIENVHLEVVNFSLSLSSLIQSSIIHAEGICTYIKNALVENIAFQSKSSFYLSNTILSSALIANMSVKNIVLHDYSVFLGVNVTTARKLALDFSLDGGENGTFAETRPFMVCNSSFDSIQLDLSYLLASTNPMVVVQQNKFVKVTMSSSRLFEFGDYHFFLSFESYISGFNNTKTYYPKNVSVLTYPFAENAIFQDYLDFGRIYHTSRARIFEYNLENLIFFIWVSENKITNITAGNTQQLMAFFNFEMKNGTIAVINNTLLNISSTETYDDFKLISGTMIRSGIVAFNTFSTMSLSGYALYFFSLELHSLLLYSNHLSQTQHLAMYYLTSTVCDQIKISNLTALDVNPKQSFIDITCNELDTSITIEGSTFIDVFQSNTQASVESLNLISLHVKKNPITKMPLLSFQNNYFNNITVLDTQGYTELSRSSLIYILSLQSQAKFSNNSFSLIKMIPAGNIITISVPLTVFSNCTFDDLSFGSVDGAIYIISNALSVRDCIFSKSQSLDSDGVGLLKLMNPQPQIAMLVNIAKTTFKNNVAPYSTVLYVKDSAIVLNIDDSEFSDNYVTEPSSILTFWNTSGSNISIKNSFFRQNVYYPRYPYLKMIAVESSGPNASVQLSETTVKVVGMALGVFISISGQQPVTLFATRVSYSTGPYSSFPSFGLFEGDNFNATFTGLSISKISLGHIGLFTVNANTASQKEFSEWRLNIIDSVFEGMSLREGLIVITSDNSSSTALNNLNVRLENTRISQVRWLGPSGGVVRSLTHNIGRNFHDVDFAITMNNCTFANLTGETGLIFNAIEPVFDSVVLLMNCKFHGIVARELGAILNPSIRMASNFTNDAITNNNHRQNPTFRVIGNTFQDISSSSGALIYWTSASRGSVIDSTNNHFANIYCVGNGGLIFAHYLLLEDQLLDSAPARDFIFISRNDVMESISRVRNGGIIYAEGVTQLFNITLINITLSDIKSFGNGGVIYISSSSFQGTMPITEVSSRLLGAFRPAQLGTINVSRSSICNIGVENGGIIYESTSMDTVSLSFDSNYFKNISALARGGAFYIVKPKILTSNNTFEDVTAKMAGPIIYCVSDEVNFANFAIENTITFPLEYSYSFAPTNLLVNFYSLRDGSSPPIEHDTKPPFLPIFSNLTSYSLSDYQITLTLISNGSQGTQIVYDESINPLITLNFISIKGESAHNYVSSNCSNSSCTVLASTIILRGLAGDLILVNTTYNSSVYAQFQQFYIRLRSCLPGEINSTSSYECIYCKPGTYSLTPNDRKCSECPNGAICNGESNIIIKQGFYRSNVSLLKVHMIDCNDSGRRCLGGVNNSCARPFSGPVCLQCNLENGYFMSSNSGTCVECSKKSTLIAIASLLLIASIIYQIVMSIVTYRENKKIHVQYQMHHRLNMIQPGQFLVILTTYTQIINVLANLDENTLSNLLKVTNVVGNPYTQVMFSLQCLYLLYIHDPFEALRFRVLVYVFSPMVKILLVIIFECFRNLIWKDSEGQRLKKSLVRVGAVAVVLILLEQPGIIGVLCKCLTCSKLDPFGNEYYITTQNSVRCYTTRYNFFKIIIVIPALIFWALIIPLGIFVILCKIRRRLFASEPLRIIFGNLYNSYYESTYYWGVVIIVFKVTIYVLNAVLSTSPVFKGVILMMIIHLYYYLLKKKSPYPHSYLFLAEKFCCFTYMIVLILVFIRFSTDHYGVRYACSVLIVIAVSFAGLYIILNTLWVIVLKVQRYVEKIKEKKKQKQIILKTLEALKRYHENHPSHRDKHHRRGGICLELPERLRNSEEYEVKEQENPTSSNSRRPSRKASFYQYVSGLFPTTLETNPPVETNEPARNLGVTVPRITTASNATVILDTQISHHEELLSSEERKIFLYELNYPTLSDTIFDKDRTEDQKIK